MKKKGFTLTEVLGVIIIIGIIALITVPIITGIIEGSRREAFKDSVLNAFRQLDYYKVENNIKKIPEEGVDINKIGLKEGSFETGKFRLDGNGEEKAINVSDGRYCAVGVMTDVQVYKGSCDLTKPTCELEVKGIKGVGGWSSENVTVTMTTSKASTGGLTYGIGIQENYSKSVENGKKGKGEYEAEERGEVYCYVQNIGEEKGTNAIEVKIDKTEPIESDFTYQTTSKSITVVARGKDLESGIVRYQYSKDDGKTWSEIQSSNNYTFHNLTTGEYKIKVRVYNGTYEEDKKESNLKKESKTKLVSTAELTEPTYEVSTNKWTNQNVDVTVKYEGEGVKLFKTTVGVTSNINAVKCSRVYNGEYTCEGEPTKNIEVGSWYKVENNPVLTFSENGSVIAQVVDGINYKTGSSLTVGNIDKTNPSITISTSGVKTDRTTVTANCTDNESGISKYEFSKDNGTTWINGGTTSSYTFTGLTKGTNYTFKVRCTNGAGGTSEASKEQATSNMTNPTIAQTSQTPSSGTWAQSRVIQITYNSANIQTPVYYFKSTVGATVGSGVVTGTCGTSTDPGACSNSNVTTLVANTWYRTSSKTPSITYKANGVLYAVMSDGTNLSGTATLSISNIDTSAPSVPTVTYNGGSNTCTWKNNYNITLTSSDNVGIAYYEIDVDNNGTADATTGANFIPPNGYSTCLWRVRAVDHAGNRSGWTSVHHIHMDTQQPTHTNWWWGEVTKDVARLYIQATDNIGIGRVQCPTSTATGGYSNWHWFEGVWDASANAYRCDITPGTFGHYGQNYITHLYMYDHAGNGGYYNATSVAIPAACPYNVGQTWDYAYTGGVQGFTTPCSGTYKLEVWGAQGGSANGYSGGLGGYSYGNISLTRDVPIYIAVGGGSGYSYNGGGTGISAGNGGGATHIATTNRGELKNYSSYKSEVIIVAGGGGGSAGWSADASVTLTAGTGGGTNGGTATTIRNAGNANWDAGTGGTQTAGGGGSLGDKIHSEYFGGKGSFGIGGSPTSFGGAGGGGGWYGGGSGSYYNSASPGGGGSGYLNTSQLISGTTGMQNGVQSGHGYARITLVSISG